MLSEKQIRSKKKELLKTKRVLIKSLKRCKKNSRAWHKNNINIACLSGEIKTLTAVLKGRPLEFLHKSPKEITSFVRQMSMIKSMVRAILMNDLPSRDDDNVLCVRVWERQGLVPNMKFSNFEKKLYLGTFSSPESIGRCRRALQEKHITLRGKLYEKRHQAEDKFINQYKLEF